MQDVVTDAFKRRQQDGQIILNDMTQTTIRKATPPIEFNYSFGEGTSNWYTQTGTFSGAAIRASLPLIPYTSVSVDSSFNAGLTMNDAIANIDSNASQILVTLAEAKKTLRLLDDTALAAKRLNKTFGHILRKKGVNPNWSPARLARWKKTARKQAVKAAANAWLTYRYGMRPLVFDVKNIIESASKKPNLRFTAKASATFEARSDDTIDTNLDTTRWTAQREAMQSRQITCGIVCEVRNPFYGYVQHYGLDDIFEAAWELVPYSFVVDWFSKVGTAFDIMPSTLGVDVKGHWTVHRVRYSMRNVFSGSPLQGAVNTTVSGQGFATLYDERVERETGYGSPDLSILPLFKGTLKMDWKKTVDLFALASKFL